MSVSHNKSARILQSILPNATQLCALCKHCCIDGLTLLLFTWHFFSFGRCAAISYAQTNKYSTAPCNYLQTWRLGNRRRRRRKFGWANMKSITNFRDLSLVLLRRRTKRSFCIYAFLPPYQQYKTLQI